MANKTYTVMKDGEILKELKTLAAAKKLADLEDAEVFDGGLCVYTPDPMIEPIPAQAATDTSQAVVRTPDHYRLTHRMNVRTVPSTEADKVRVEEKGAFVDVATVENDWLHLTDGNFIMFGGGKFAEKI